MYFVQLRKPIECRKPLLVFINTYSKPGDIMNNKEYHGHAYMHKTKFAFKLTDQRRYGWTNERSDGPTNEKKTHKPIQIYNLLLRYEYRRTYT